MRAVRIARRLAREGRAATPQERDALAAFSGWGASTRVFDERDGARTAREGSASDALLDALGEEGYAHAREATLTSYYTPPEVAWAVARALSRAGFGAPGAGDAALEPGCGHGTFLAALSDTGNWELHGVECDPSSAEVARALLPQADVKTAYLERAEVARGAFAAAVGNVPFLPGASFDHPRAGRVALHDYFLLEAVESLRPGGVAALLTSSYTLDKSGGSVRRALGAMCEVVDAVRLPQETFDAHAATRPKATDLVVLRRRDADLDPLDERALRGSLADDAAFGPAKCGMSEPVCRAFLPGGRGAVIGELVEARPGDNGIPRPHVSATFAGGPGEIAAALHARLSQTMGGPGALRARLGEAARPASVVVRPEGRPARSEYMLGPSGEVWLGSGDSWELAEPAAPGGTRLSGMVSLRDAVRALYDLEADPGAGEARVAGEIARVRGMYEAFAARWGRVNDRGNARAWDARADRSWGTVSSLERRAADGSFAGLSDCLSARVVSPAPPRPERSDDPMEALSIAMNELGRPDLGRIGELLGTDAAGALSALGDAVLVTPSGETALTEEWLSGDLGARLAEIDAAAAAPRAVVRAARAAWLGELAGPYLAQAAGYDWPRLFVGELRRSGVWDAEVSANPAECGACARDVAGLAADRDYTAPDGRRLSRWSHGAACGGSVALLYLDAVEESGRGAVEGAPDPIWRWCCDTLGSWGTAGEDAREGPYASSSPVCAVARGEVLACAAAVRAAALCPRTVPESDLRLLLEAEARAAVRKGRDGRPRGSELLSALLPDGWLEEAGGGCAAPAEAAGRALEALLAEPEKAELALARARARLDAAGSAQGPARVDAGALRSRREAFMGRFEGLPEARARIAGLEALRSRVEAAMPEPLTRAEIRAELGSPWIPADVYVDFMLETFSPRYMSEAQRARVRVEHEAQGGWSVAGGDLWRSVPEGVRARWGVVGADGHGYNGVQLMAAVMNNTDIRIKRDSGEYAADGTPRKTDDVEATVRAQNLSEELRAAFKEWVWADEARAGRLEQVYNRRHNTVAPRRVDGSYLRLPDLSPRVELRPHQRDAVARAMQAREGTLFAHVVGAGKTYTGIVAMHESVRIGRARKPLVVVQRPTLGQWAASWAELYPRDRVLVMSDADMTGPAARERFWASVRSEAWDAVVVPHSAFDLVELSPQAESEYRRERLSALMEQERGRSARGLSVKQAEKARRRAEERVAEADRLAERAGDVEGVPFDSLGVDALLVDEAHYYKNLPLDGKIDLPGVSSAGAGKCDRFRAKLEWMRSRGFGANIVFMTGTPVTNSMAELYKMEAYLAPGLLESTGLSSFSDWASTFGEVQTSLEVDITGDRLRSVRRFSKFVNVPELMSSYRAFADVVGAGDVDLAVPACRTVPVAVEATPEQEAYVAELSERADEIRAGRVDPKADNLLKVTGDGRSAAISMKMLARDDTSVAPEEGGKLGAVADVVARIWREEEGAKGVQLVFCDMGTPSGGSKWDVYSDLRRRLVERGVPEGEIASIYDHDKTDRAREALFERVRAGEVRVLMGSTAKLGTGVNVQNRLRAIHHVDCPWRPADVEQRRGRMVRQGNSYANVESYHYVTQGTFDSYLYQTVERKSRFIAQMSADPASLEREVDDIDQESLDYATIKELTVSDPRVWERTHAENEVRRLSLEEAAHARQQREVARRLQTMEAALAELEREREGLTRDPRGFDAAARAAGSEDAWSHLRVAGSPMVRPSDPREANRLLIEAVRAVGEGAEAPVASLCGCEVWARVPRGRGAVDAGTGVRLSLRTPGGGEVRSRSDMPLGLSGSGSPAAQVARLAREGAAGWGAERQARYGRAASDVAEARGELARPFGRAAELAAARSRLRALDEGRAREEAGAGAPQAASPSHTAASAGRPHALRR